MRLLVIILLIWNCGACTTGPENKRISALTFYDINGLIDEQIRMLDSISPDLYKEAIIDGNKEDEVLRKLDSATLADEIGIFRSADINLPTLTDSYNIEERSTADHNFLIYRSKYPNQTEVDSLRVILNKELQPSLIEVNLSSTNALFDSKKRLELYFEDIDSKSLLKNYAIYGWQKMTTRDQTTFALEGEIRFP